MQQNFHKPNLPPNRLNQNTNTPASVGTTLANTYGSTSVESQNVQKVMLPEEESKWWTVNMLQFPSTGGGAGGPGALVAVVPPPCCKVTRNS